MINELYQLINALEKINIRLGTKIVTDQELIEGKDTIVHIQNNQKLLMDVIQKADDPHADIEESLVLMYEYLENIVQDLDNIHVLVFSTMTRYGDYKDKIERTKS